MILNENIFQLQSAQYLLLSHRELPIEVKNPERQKDNVVPVSTFIYLIEKTCDVTDLNISPGLNTTEGNAF